MSDTQKAICRKNVSVLATERMVMIVPMFGSIFVRRSSSACRARFGSPCTRATMEVFSTSRPVGRNTPASLMPVKRNPGTSRATPTTVTIRACTSPSSAAAPGLILRSPLGAWTPASGSSLKLSPTPLPSGHNARATDSETIATG